MQKKFLLNLGLLLLLNLLIKPFWIFGIDRTVQNMVGAEQYGIYFAVMNFSFLFTILLDLGITNFNNRNISQNSHLLNKHFSSIIVLRLILAFIYLIITLSVGVVVGYDSFHFKMLIFLSINQFLLTFILYLRSNISGLQMFKTDSLLSVLDRAIMILICGLLLWGHVTKKEFRIEWFVYAQTLSYLITILIVIAIVIKKSKFKKLNWNYPFLVMIIKQSFPFALLSLLMMFYNRIDSVMLERFLPNGAEQAGIYASAFRLLDAVNNFSLLFTILLLPMFSKMIKQKESVEELVKLAFTLLIIPAIILSIGSCFYSDHLMKLLYSQHKAELQTVYTLRMNESIVVFSILMWCVVAISTTYVFGTLLTANGSLKLLNITAAAGMVINIVLNIVLIPRMEAVGSAWASLVTQAITALAQLILAAKVFNFKFNYKYIALLGSFILTVLILNLLTRNLMHGWIINFILMVCGSLLFAFAVKLINLKALFSILLTKTK